jgi:hypothetical protein
MKWLVKGHSAAMNMYTTEQKLLRVLVSIAGPQDTTLYPRKMSEISTL